MFKLISDYKNPKSFASQSRLKRFQFFLTQLKKFKGPIKILDIGGTQNFWKDMGFINNDKVEIHLLNLDYQEVNYDNFKSLKGDATQMPEIETDYYDVVFSNSVIEHLYTWENQIKMAQEIKRVGKNYFIQTPNLNFPIEPHFLFPFFQFLPVSLRVALITNFNMGHHKVYKDKNIAVDRIKEVRLLSRLEMKSLFPNAQFYFDKFLFFNKSFVAFSFEN